MGCASQSAEGPALVGEGTYSQLFTDRTEPICGGTISFLDSFVEEGFAAIAEQPPGRRFIRYEWHPETSEDEALAEVRQTVTYLNRLNDRCDGELIETDQREDICAFLIGAAASCAFNPDQVDQSEPWREW